MKLIYFIGVYVATMVTHVRHQRSAVLGNVLQVYANFRVLQRVVKRQNVAQWIPSMVIQVLSPMGLLARLMGFAVPLIAIINTAFVTTDLLMVVVKDCQTTPIVMIMKNVAQKSVPTMHVR
jgi:hypothetical protein